MQPSESADAELHGETRAPRRSLEHWVILAAALGTIALLLVLAFVIEPDPRGFGTHEQLGLPSCKMLDITGYPCPGCGVTTSIALAARGRVLESLVNQPFGFATAILIPVFAVWALFQHARGRDVYVRLTKVRLGRAGILLASFMLVAWLYKCAIIRGWIPRIL